MKKVILLLMLLSSLLHAQNIKNIVLYYATWNYGSLSGIKCPPESLSLSKVTHLIHFDNPNTTKTPPYFTYMMSDSLTGTALGSRNELFYAANSNPGSYPLNPMHWQQRLITAAHANNVQVLLTIQAVDAASLNYVAEDSGRTEVMTDAVCWFAKRFGYSGLELDWEGWITPFPNAMTMNRFVRMLRRKMDAIWGSNPRPPLMISCGSSQSDIYWKSQDNYVDAYVMQMYDFDQAWGGSCNILWYISPLCKSIGVGDSHREVAAWDTRGPASWKTAGHNISTISALLPAYGTLYRGDTTLGACPVSNSTSYSYQSCLNLLNYGGSYRRDGARGDIPYITGTAISKSESYGLTLGQKFRMTFEDSISVVRKVKYLDSLGCVTVGFYDITGAINTSAKSAANRFPILNWIRSAIVSQSTTMKNSKVRR